MSGGGGGSNCFHKFLQLGNLVQHKRHLKNLKLFSVEEVVFNLLSCLTILNFREDDAFSLFNIKIVLSTKIVF